jgi:hypothetical protein
MTVVPSGDASLLDAQIEYHLSAGIDHIVVGVFDPMSDTALARLGAFGPPGAVSVERLGTDQATARRTLRGLAVDRGADWVIESDGDEFWWPRGRSLKEVLEPVPSRYTAVQALVRVFLPRPPREDRFEENLTVRPSLLRAEARPEPLTWALRPVHRVRGGKILDAQDLRFVPLRAWYPIEVLRFPLRDAQQAATVRATPREARSTVEAAFLGSGDGTRSYDELVVDDDRLRSGVQDGSLVIDTRLRDYLRASRLGRDTSALTMPSIVDEASYAVECAAVGEVDLAGLDRTIRELEARIVALEQRFWARVVRRLSRMTRRSDS